MSDLVAIIDRWRDGGCSAEIAVMELLISAEDVDTVARAVTGIPALETVLGANRAGCERICAMLKSGVDSGGATAASVADGIAFARRLFDWSVTQDEAASVALYSLGSAEILARATDEIVGELDRRGLLAPTSRVLDLGCGVGRLLVPLAARVQHVLGMDVSPGMVAAARRRCAGLASVEVRESNGRDLAGAGDRAYELVLAVDSFPYVVQAGGTLAAELIDEARRVLRPGGHLAIFNFSYRGDDPLDRDEFTALTAGMEVLVLGEAPFSLWNGRLFLSRQGTPSSAR